MENVNKCSFVGGIVQNPSDRLKLFEGGSVLRISLAIETPDTKQSGEAFVRTAYANLVLWGQDADRVARMRRGEKIEVECQLQTGGSYTDRDGNRKRLQPEFRVLLVRPAELPASRPASKPATKRRA